MGIAALIAHGWLPRRARLPVLGAGVAMLGASWIEEKWQDRKNAARNAEEFVEDVPPIVRIAQTIFTYAAKENAESIRLNQHNRGVEVSYQIEGEWREQMRIPLYVWNPLRQTLFAYVRNGATQFENPEFFGPKLLPIRLTNLRADLRVKANEETLEIQFENSVPQETEFFLTDVSCFQCRELNAPANVWCWNCYAILEDAAKIKHRNYEAAIAASLAVLGILTLTSSGWWPRRTRLPVLGAGVLAFASTFAWEKWEEREKRHQKRRDERRGIEIVHEAPVIRVATTILLDAMRNRVETIRLQEHGNIEVFHQIEGDWHGRQTLPPGIWGALRGQLLEMVKGGITCQGRKYVLSAQLHSDARGETLEISSEPSREHDSEQVDGVKIERR